MEVVKMRKMEDKKTEDKTGEILLYSKKLPLLKQEEALDYIKWLWLNVGKGSGKNLKPVVEKIREIQAKHPAQKDWDSVETIRKWRDSR